MNSISPDLEALQLALKMETDGYNFFKDASERIKNTLAKETFKSFADWELEHIEFIKKMYQELKEKGKWISIEEMSQKKGAATSAIKTIFKKKHEEIDEHVKIDSSDLDAYRLARDIEDKAVVFYREKAESTDNEPAKQFYRFMIDLESEHYQILDSSYRYFENPSQWHLDEEGPLLDGG